MGNKVSTNRTLGKLPATSKIKRSSVNQLPPQRLKDQYSQHLNHEHYQPHENVTHAQHPELHQHNIASDSVNGKGKLDHSTGSNIGNIPGKDGHDPQGDFIKILNELGRSVTSTTTNNIKNEKVINQLTNRNKIYQENKTKTDLIDGRRLTSILNDLARYDREKILQENNISWGHILDHFKVPTTYKEFKDNKEGEIGHEGVREGKTLSDEHFKQGRKMKSTNKNVAETTDNQPPLETDIWDKQDINANEHQTDTETSNVNKSDERKKRISID